MFERLDRERRRARMRVLMGIVVALLLAKHFIYNRMEHHFEGLPDEAMIARPPTLGPAPARRRAMLLGDRSAVEAIARRAEEAPERPARQVDLVRVQLHHFPEAALEAALAAHERFPQSPRARLALAVAAQRAGQLDVAREHAATALAAQPSLWEARLILLGAALEAGDTRIAQDHVDALTPGPVKAAYATPDGPLPFAPIPLASLLGVSRPSPTVEPLSRFDGPDAFTPLQGSDAALQWGQLAVLDREQRAGIVAGDARAVATFSLRDGGGVWQNIGQQAQEAGGVLVVDADQDGDPDLLGYGPRGLRFTRSAAGEELIDAGNVWRQPVTGVIPGDLDADGDLDFLLLGAESDGKTPPPQFLRNDLSPGLRPGGALLEELGTPLRAGLAADLDADGRPELLLLTGDALLQLRNLPAWEREDWQPQAPPAFATTPLTCAPVPPAQAEDAGLTLADLDGDGHEELLVWHAGAAHYCRGGATGFTSGGALPFGGPLLAKDFDLDGRADLAGPGHLRLDPLGAGRELRLPEGAPLDAGDLDGDGMPELLIREAAGLRVLRNGLRPALQGTAQLRLVGSVDPLDGAGAIVDAIHVDSGRIFRQRAGLRAALSLPWPPAREPSVLRIRWPHGPVGWRATAESSGQNVEHQPYPQAGPLPAVFAEGPEGPRFVTDIFERCQEGIAAGLTQLLPAAEGDRFAVASEQLTADADGTVGLRIVLPYGGLLRLDRVQAQWVTRPAGHRLDTGAWLDHPSPPLAPPRLLRHRGPIPGAKDGSEVELADAIAATDGFEAAPAVPARWLREGVGVYNNVPGLSRPYPVTLSLDATASADTLLFVGRQERYSPSAARAALHTGGAYLRGAMLQLYQGQRWRSVSSLPMPAGVGRASAVPIPALGPAFPDRVRTGFTRAAFFDEIAQVSASDASLDSVTAPLASARLRYWGFPAEAEAQGRLDPQRRVPARHAQTRTWLTRYGPVSALLSPDTPERSVVASAGDAVELRFGEAPSGPAWLLVELHGRFRPDDPNTGVPALADAPDHRYRHRLPAHHLTRR